METPEIKNSENGQASEEKSSTVQNTETQSEVKEVTQETDKTETGKAPEKEKVKKPETAPEKKVTKRSAKKTEVETSELPKAGDTVRFFPDKKDKELSAVLKENKVEFLTGKIMQIDIEARSATVKVCVPGKPNVMRVLDESFEGDIEKV